MIRRTFLIACGLLVAVAGTWAQPPALDEWVERARKEFEVPGLAIGIVKDGQTVLVKGYGERKMGTGARVDTHTLFGIASNTKAFTAAALAILVDEKKVSWDDPVTKHLPGFAMADPYVTRELTIRDLLSHRSGLGLGAGDLMYWPDTAFTRAQVLAGARYLKPASSFRSKYAYNNLMFVVAGEVVAAVSGMPYEEFVQKRIFAPLGMKEARITNDGLTEANNIATPHSKGWRLEGTLAPIGLTRDQVWAAAAGIKANVTDLSEWMKTQLNGGKGLFSEAAGREMWSAQIMMPVGKPHALLAEGKTDFAAYGLGWTLRQYRGYKVVMHGGALTGMLSQTLLVPELKLGIVILTNQEEGGTMTSLANLIVDHYLGVKSPDWIGNVKTVSLERRKAENKREEEDKAKRVSGTKPTLPLGKYAGTWQDAWYGKTTVREDNGALFVKMEATPAMTGKLDHWQGDTFVAKWQDNTVPDAYVMFQLDENLQPVRMKMKAISDVADFSFDYHDLDFVPVKK